MDGIVFWHWWMLGLALLIVEILMPGTFCLWLGIAAFVTGIVAWGLPSLGWQAEVMVFAALSLVAVGLWFKLRVMSRDQPDNGLNQRGRGYLGQVFELVEPIQNGYGKVRIEDTVWRVSGEDLPLGMHVRVTALEGATLRVERAG